MPVKAGEPLDPDATRARILQVASRLFYERGVHTTGINDIAREAEASKLSIYRYFRSKDQLVQATMLARSDRIHDWLARRTAPAAPGRDRLIALFDLLIEWYGEQGFRGCAVINSAVETRSGEGFRSLAQRHLDRYRDLLHGELAQAGVTPSRAAPLARQLLVLIEGSTVVTAIDGHGTAGEDARAAAEALIDSVLRSAPDGKPA